MQSKAKCVLRIVLVAGFFSLAIIAEEVTHQFGGPMKIHGLPIRNAAVTGAWHPDFLWMGTAWAIHVRSDEGVELILDDRIYRVPQGVHIVYSNHDHTNTGEFGDIEFWGYPKKVQVGPLENEALRR